MVRDDNYNCIKTLQYMQWLIKVKKKDAFGDLIRNKSKRRKQKAFFNESHFIKKTSIILRIWGQYLMNFREQFVWLSE